MSIDNLLQNLLQLLLAYVEIYFQLHEVLRIASVYESQILRQDLIENKSSQSGLYRTGDGLSGCIYLVHTHMDTGM